MRYSKMQKWYTQRVGLDALLRFLVAAGVIHFFFVNSFRRSGKMALLVQTPARCDASAAVTNTLYTPTQ